MPDADRVVSAIHILTQRAADVGHCSRRRLGHATPSTTLGVYAHLFDQANHAAEMRDALSAKFGGLLNGNAVETTRRNGSQDGVSKLVQLSGIGR